MFSLLLKDLISDFYLMYDDFVIPQYQRISLPQSKLHGFYSILFFQIVMIFLIFHECFFNILHVFTEFPGSKRSRFISVFFK